MNITQPIDLDGRWVCTVYTEQGEPLEIMAKVYGKCAEQAMTRARRVAGITGDYPVATKGDLAAVVAAVADGRYSLLRELQSDLEEGKDLL